MSKKAICDGNFALMHSETIDFRAEGSDGLLAPATSGEGLLQTFKGTGYIGSLPHRPFTKNLLRPPASASSPSLPAPPTPRPAAAANPVRLLSDCNRSPTVPSTSGKSGQPARRR